MKRSKIQITVGFFNNNIQTSVYVKNIKTYLCIYEYYLIKEDFSTCM